MSWTIELTVDAARTLRKMDPQAARRIRKVLSAIETLEDPRIRGKALTGPLRGLWRYRIGDYRVVCDLIDARLVVLVIEIDHRSSIYYD